MEMSVRLIQEMYLIVRKVTAVLKVVEFLDQYEHRIDTNRIQHTFNIQW